MGTPRRALWLVVALGSACDGAATRPDAAWAPDAPPRSDAGTPSPDAAAALDAAPADARGCAADGAAALDGALDADAVLIAGGDASPRLAIARHADGVLYVATDDAGEGSDHFLLLSADAPGDRTLAAPFAKVGTVAAGAGALRFLADENDNGFTGWFQREDGAGDTLLDGRAYASATAENGGVLEGTIDLVAVFGEVPATLYLAVAVYGTGDGGALVAAAQTPAGDGDGDVEAEEFVAIDPRCAP